MHIRVTTTHAPRAAPRAKRATEGQFLDGGEDTPKPRLLSVELSPPSAPGSQRRFPHCVPTPSCPAPHLRAPSACHQLSGAFSSPQLRPQLTGAGLSLSPGPAHSGRSVSSCPMDLPGEAQGGHAISPAPAGPAAKVQGDFRGWSHAFLTMWHLESSVACVIHKHFCSASTCVGAWGASLTEAMGRHTSDCACTHHTHSLTRHTQTHADTRRVAGGHLSHSPAGGGGHCAGAARKAARPG